MHANYTNEPRINSEKLIHPELSYTLTGIFFSVHNELGRFSRERQYSDILEEKLKNASIPYERERVIGDSGNIVDFIVDDKILIEVKAKQLIARDDFHQTQRYLQSTGCKLALLVNFRNKFLKPIRIVRLDTPAKSRFEN